MQDNPAPTRPSTAWELCEQAAEAIEFQPKNYTQGAWAIDPASCIEQEFDREAKDGEVCGTAFCRAGWMYTTLLGKSHTPAWWRDNADDIPTHMHALFVRAGIDPYDTIKLFDANALEHEQGRERPVPKWGTKAYAKAGAKGLRQFMATHEAKLKAYKITDEDIP